MTTKISLPVDLATLASQCVQCGLCLPHCPTYRKTLHEADSPRGRVALMKGLLNGELDASPVLFAHIDQCLACRACEAVCPSRVKYGHLLQEVRPFLESRRPAPFFRRLLLGLMASPPRLAWWGRFLRLWQASGLQSLFRAMPFWHISNLGRAELLLPDLPEPHSWNTHYPAQSARGEVALLLGCAARELDTVTLRATLYLLNKLGFDVHIPADQRCCGALHRHAGDTAGANTLLEKNRAAFSSQRFDALLVSATGCAVELQEQGEGLPPVVEICEFLVSLSGWSNLDFMPLYSTIAVHEPCSQRNCLDGAKSVFSLLAHIPGIKMQTLPGNNQCCGGAGAYPLAQPVISEKLRADKITAMQSANCSYIVTANIGCALQLGAGVREARLQVSILHPVTLLARQLGFSE